MAQLVKKPPAIWETWARSLGWEDALEKGKAAHSMDSVVHGVAKSQTRRRDFYSHLASRGQLVISGAIFIVTTGEGLLTFVGKGRECC